MAGIRRGFFCAFGMINPEVDFVVPAAQIIDFSFQIADFRPVKF
jgi:hypothetical protein